MLFKDSLGFFFGVFYTAGFVYKFKHLTLFTLLVDATNQSVNASSRPARGPEDHDSQNCKSDPFFTVFFFLITNFPFFLFSPYPGGRDI